jgi:hypothetical protein
MTLHPLAAPAALLTGSAQLHLHIATTVAKKQQVSIRFHQHNSHEAQQVREEMRPFIKMAAPEIMPLCRLHPQSCLKPSKHCHCMLPVATARMRCDRTLHSMLTWQCLDTCCSELPVVLLLHFCYCCCDGRHISPVRPELFVQQQQQGGWLQYY